MRTYKVLLNTKFVGRHITTIEARDMNDAKRKASRLENEYNEVKAIVEDK